VDLIEADDREAFAETHGIPYNDGAVKVEIELVSGGDVPEQYIVEQVSRQGVIVVAWIQVDNLVSVALDEDVRIVRGVPEPRPH
jgi:hypothetical protein